MSLPSEVDIAVVGAGSAGIAAGLRLRTSGRTLVLLEARERVGGRAHTVDGPGASALDLGCGWLHSADVNAWAARFEAQGRAIDRTPPPWGRPAVEANFPAADQRDYRAAFERFDAAMEAAGDAPDRPASDLLDPGGRWNALLNAFSGAYNGAPLSALSVRDYAAYADTGVNWRAPGGYGAGIAAAAAGLPVALGAAVTRIDQAGPRLRLETASGTLTARAAIVTVPTDLLAHEAIRFDPPLPDKVDAAAALPLGCADKVFIALAHPEAFPREQIAFGRTDTARSGSHHLRPFGRPMVESYYGGAVAAELERAGPGAMAAFATDELVGLFGSSVRAGLSPIVSTAWDLDPWSRGAYSHARVGCAGMRARLAEPVDGRLFFAGEATSPQFFSTAHGAHDTGVRAADEALAARG